MMKQSIKLFSTIVIVLALFVFCDLVLGGVMSYFYRKSKYGIFHRQIYSLTESNEEVLILGSSRAAHHYVPSIFKDSIGMTCFNAGSDGMCIYYHYAVLSSYLDSGRMPKLVIYDVNNFELTHSNGATFTLDAALDRLAPHYGENKVIDSLFLLNGWKEYVKMASHTYRYNSKLIQLIKCNLLLSVEDNGYEAVYGELPHDAELKDVSVDTISEVEERKQIYFIKMLDKLKAYNVPLLLVYSPMYERGVGDRIEEINTIAHQYNVPVLNLSNMPQLMRPLLFKDIAHLNNEGAHKFTELLVDSIRKSGLLPLF